MWITKHVQKSYEMLLYCLQQYRGYTTNSACHNACIEERRVGQVDGGPGDGKSTQLQFALTSAELLSALHPMMLLDNHSVPQQPIAPGIL